ncbi:hypothetical protein B5807_03324 [Epicoccum nigrum]|uniref:Uncharacterized protein n=1 Tax=Epicoccum nigrum TaxID=105696 RepID=A0A1Y2M598_EPING|nr:hypothetical protein B5807_03324 [Epicoccum nigrum]
MRTIVQNSRKQKAEDEMKRQEWENNEENYRPAQSPLLSSNLAEDVQVNERELEEPRKAEELKEMRKQTDIVAKEVGYLYFVGSAGLMERWEEELHESNMFLIHRGPKQEP